jgi:hypothetical protein
MTDNATIHGGCHCDNIAYRYTTATPVEHWTARACPAIGPLLWS